MTGKSVRPLQGAIRMGKMCGLTMCRKEQVALTLEREKQVGDDGALRSDVRTMAFSMGVCMSS